MYLLTKVILIIMRIFIEGYSLSNLIKKIPSLKKYLVETITKLEITSNEGEYYIENDNVYKLIINDKKIVVYENYYNNLNLLLDSSEIIIVETNHIPNRNIDFALKYFYFSLNNSSKLKFVIKTHDDNIDDLNNIKPIDFYFEIGENVEINSIFFKDEINVFLSLLN